MSMILHDLPMDRVKPEKFTAVIEIPKGSKVKYEIDEDTGMLALDRILSTATAYPWNYGYIPRTFAFDGDPLDIVLICTETLYPNTLVECKPIGLLKMIDGGDQDDKVITVATKDRYLRDIESVDQLPKHIVDELKHFFSVYKALEGKVTETKEMLGPDAAKDMVSVCMKRYREKFPDM
ncbi:MAG: inorganic diphosphatase [Candidatus Methanomethylophilaceae archaeon]|nr:inorganic diphosphatase [Candidatus Methanomethylophilaceae archaeon]MBR7006269.1 inorganic diphosphatase [Candidatus Methanomethylophilaceae archaeon]